MEIDFFKDSLSILQTIFLCMAIFSAFIFEFINGFHDTANAVATVIYTKSLRPWTAVFISGGCNFLGVYLGGTVVAFTIVHLLPVDIIVNVGSNAGLAMIMAMLGAAVIWNLATWMRGLPASSSHTLIGSIIGVGITHSIMVGKPYGNSLTWHKMAEIFISLLTSPMIGFVIAALLVWVMCRIPFFKKFDMAPKGRHAPPWSIRVPIILSSAAVSYTHGSNDGQKGIGIIMLILMGILPANYALNMAYRGNDIANTGKAVRQISLVLEKVSGKHIVAAESVEGEKKNSDNRLYLMRLVEQFKGISKKLEGRENLNGFNKQQLSLLRTEILMADEELSNLSSTGKIVLSPLEKKEFNKYRREMRGITEYAPYWVICGVALSLGLGTMIGWRRVAVTIGEKIGKEHLTYTQGLGAQAVTALTIYGGNITGLPVSTTHILSSSVAGGMAATHSGLHSKTVRDILLAWIFTFPVAMLLSGSLFAIFRIFF